MGKFFADEHASAKSQFENLPHGLADTEQIKTQKNANTYEELLELAKRYCWQLRYREAIEAYSRAVELRPDDTESDRKSVV